MKRKSLLLMMLLALFSSGAWAQTPEIYTSYTFISGTNTNDHPRQLVDNNKSTRWLVLQKSTYANSPAYCQFQSAAPITPVGYVITTGSDSGTWHRRNPKKWKIEASTDNSTWVTLHEITDGGLPHQDKADKATIDLVLNSRNEDANKFQPSFSLPRTGKDITYRMADPNAIPKKFQRKGKLTWDGNGFCPED